ncbi:tripartite tricarboxylate transporter substrate-binding protein [Cupriavidus oxalaticus]|uniref:Tripartite tricarboxylate transporter substrate binding protein n=1 Tax=Cupriavidus oxalaticus TaxID=96344 RepID=A0A5P3VRM7_9BURK|nr:tripartite tricarboxylate transporter substrate-binding protein [Cupriavidus oxalaticus]QEZ49006.1 tripartite tricarboxylate transporter substrate binding protein [Cupriavidus oxalaticus]
MNRRSWLLAMSGALALPAFRPASAAAFPDRPVRMIVPFLAGSSPDLFARMLGTELGSRLRQPVVIENMPGAGGLIGTLALTRAAPDGYTLGLLANTQLISAHMYRKKPFDLVTDCTPITSFSGGASVVVVKSSSNIRTLPELIAGIRREPGKYNFASSGKGSIAHLAAEALLRQHDARAVHIPYKGGPEITSAILNGQVDFGIPVVSTTLPFLSRGQLTPLAVTTAARSPLLPQVPTIAEVLPPGYVLDNWGGIFAPANLPSGLQPLLFGHLHAIVAEGKLEAHIRNGGGEVRLSKSPAEFTAFIRAEDSKYGKWISDIGLAKDTHGG